MTNQETREFIASVTEMYPAYYAGQGVPENVIEAWRVALAAYRPEEALIALRSHYVAKRTAPIPSELLALIGETKAESGTSGSYGCELCRANGKGDGVIYAHVPAGVDAPYAYLLAIECPCQLMARGAPPERIARREKSIRSLEKRGWLRVAEDEEEMPF